MSTWDNEGGILSFYRWIKNDNRMYYNWKYMCIASEMSCVTTMFENFKPLKFWTLFKSIIQQL